MSETKQLLCKQFWKPKDLSDFAGISLYAARNTFKVIKKMIESEGYLTLPCFTLPTKIVLKYLNYDVDYLITIESLVME